MGRPGAKSLPLTLSLVLCLTLLGCVPLAPPSAVLDAQIPPGTGTASVPLPVRFERATTRLLELAGPIQDPLAEISGMAWYGDWLILLPQFPHRFGEGDGALFVLERSEILAYLDGTDPGPLLPRLLPFDAPGVSRLPGFEGYEAIAFDGDNLFLTVEAEPTFGGPMQGWLLRGSIDAALFHISVEAESAVALDPQAELSNMADETLVIVGSGQEAVVHTLYEANGRLVNRTPQVRRFRSDLSELDSLSLAPTEFRITDATEADAEGRFWAINYFFPGDLKLLPRGLADLRLPPVEQLLEFQILEEGVMRTRTPRYPLELDEAPRNWEGVVRLDERGFLLVTDRFPTTILAFVPMPTPAK